MSTELHFSRDEVAIEVPPVSLQQRWLLRRWGQP